MNGSASGQDSAPTLDAPVISEATPRRHSNLVPQAATRFQQAIHPQGHLPGRAAAIGVVLASEFLRQAILGGPGVSAANAAEPRPAGARPAASASAWRMPIEFVNAPVDLTSSSQSTSKAAVPVRNVQDVLERWSPDQHLYVKGDVGVSPENLDALEVWLSNSGKHWTVMLLESGDGERYTDAEGQTYSDYKAVLNGLGRGLTNQTGFGALKNKRTGEPDGAILVISVRDRRTSYFGSDAQDNRGLGEDNWEDNLDGSFRAAMRNGGNIAGAVRSTVEDVQGRLDKTIADEMVDRQEQRDRAQRELTSAGGDVSQLEQKLSIFRSSHRGLEGSLLQAPLTNWRTTLTGARSQLDAGNVQRAEEAARQVRGEVQWYATAFNRYDAAPASLGELERRLSTVRNSEFSDAAQAPWSAAMELTQEARRAHQSGNVQYLDVLSRAEGSVISAETAVEEARKDAERRQQILILLAFAITTGAAAVGVIANRRRAPIKAEAELMLKEWERVLSAKMTLIWQLIEEARTTLGPDKASVLAKFDGQTRELALQVIEDADKALILVSSAQTRRTIAQALAHPSSPWKVMSNLVYGGRYQEALDLLSKQPIVFGPDDAVTWALDRQLTDTGALEFKALVDETDLRSGRADAGLRQIAAETESVAKSLGRVQDSLDETRDIIQSIERDGHGPLFRGSAILEVLLPAAERAASQVLERVGRDPLEAHDTEAPQALQRTRNAQALAAELHDFRQGPLSRAQEAMVALANNGIPSDWIQARLQRLSEEADVLAHGAATEDASGAISAYQETLDSFVRDVKLAVYLEQANRTSLLPAVKASSEAIASARIEMGERLNLPAAHILHEEGANPSEYLHEAETLVATARMQLGDGQVSAARATMSQGQALNHRANALLEAARQSLATHGERLAQRRAETVDVQGLRPEAEAALSRIHRRYSDAVLLLGAGDITHPNANGTIDDNLAEFTALLAQAVTATEGADLAYTQGRLLEASALLTQAGLHQEQARFRIQEVHEKELRLTEAVTANAQTLRRLQGRVEAGDRSILADRRVMRRTLETFEAARSALAQARSLVEAAPAELNPFSAATALDEAQRQLDQANASAAQDRELHAAMQERIQSAGRALEEAERWSARSQTDGIADSKDIDTARSTLQQLLGAFRRLGSTSGEAHGEWMALAKEASDLETRAAASAGLLRNEVHEAKRAAEVVSGAAAAVRRAGGWSGSYGVFISGSPGNGRLTSAEHALAQGRYPDAVSSAESAKAEAINAIRSAEARVAAAQRAEQQRQDDERRAREQREQASRISSSSGFSTSSTNSGSGFSTSSW